MRWMRFLMFVFLGAATAQADDVLTALQPIQGIVGDWQGSGNSDDSKGWDEKINCAWKFPKGGSTSLLLTFSEAKPKAGQLLSEAMLTYDPERKLFVCKTHPVGASDKTLTFEGKQPPSGSLLVLDRIDKGKATDSLDRLDVKLLNDGDRIVYSFQRRVGQSKVYKPYARVALDRQGTSLAGKAASGPKCVVTGGAGTMTVAYKGKSYYVCCSGCRETFLDNPEKFIAMAEKK